MELDILLHFFPHCPRGQKEKRKKKEEGLGYSPLCVNLNDIHVLQLLKNVTSNSTTAFTEMRWTTAIPLASSIDPSEGTNTKTPPQVDLPCHGSCSENLVKKMQPQYTVIL